MSFYAEGSLFDTNPILSIFGILYTLAMMGLAWWIISAGSHVQSLTGRKRKTQPSLLGGTKRRAQDDHRNRA